MADNKFLGNVGGRTLSKPPTPGDIFFDKSFRFLTRAFTWATIFLLAFIVYKIGGEALPAFPDLGIKFLFTSAWDSSQNVYGLLPQIWGTLYSSFLALILGGFFGVTIAIFITQDFLPYKKSPRGINQRIPAGRVLLIRCLFTIQRKPPGKYAFPGGLSLR